MCATSRLIASPLALALVLALDQHPGGARLSELASAVGSPLSSLQRALEALLADRFVGRRGNGRPRYRLEPSHPAHDALVELAARLPDQDRALEVVLRASPAVEFAARDGDGLLIVLRAFADPAALLALDRALGRIVAGRTDAPALLRLDHGDLVREPTQASRHRSRAIRATPIRGTIARSFPDRSRHGDPRARRLGRPHPTLPPVSRRAVAALARRYRLRAIGLFGSAVREDFRPDSDVDLLVEPREDARLSLLDLAAIAERMEALLDRDVDVATPGSLAPEVRAQVERELVTLHG